MFTRRLLPAFLALILAACSSPSVGTNPTLEPATATETPIPPTAIPPLTLEQLKNAEINITGTTPDAAVKTIRLSNGKFEPSSDPTSADYVNINMGAQVAYGDLNGDGAQDAAIIIGENYGGTGDFVSVVAMLNQNGQPAFVGSVGIDDRPAINSLAIQNGEILLDATIHGPNDPGCCAAQPVTETFRLWNAKLTQIRHTSKTPVGTERIISIDSPAQDSEISGPFTVTGKVTIAPFENNLAYRVFVDGKVDAVVQSSVLVNASEMGGPGTFAIPLNLTESGIRGKVRIEINDFSAADGSYLAIASLFVTIK